MTLEINALTAGYGKTPIIDIAALSAKPGDFIGLVGPNGAGKTCLIKTLAHLIAPTTGVISLDSQDVSALAPQARAQQIAYLAQDRSAAWPMTVRDLVALGRAPYRGTLGRLTSADHDAVDAAMIAAACTDLKDRKFSQLSGGEKARVHLARAFAVNAPLLLADEAIAALDPFYQLSLMHSLKAEAATGKIVIACLHDLNLAKQFCSRIWVMDQGKIAEDQPAELALSADTLASVFKVQIGALGLTLKQ